MLYLFNFVSCTLVLVVCVIHSLQNLLKNQSKRHQGICKLFWAYCFVFLSVVKFLYKRQSEITCSGILQSNQVKKLSRFSQNLVVYYWEFKAKVISLSLYTARKVYKTVSCLLPSRSFPAQGQLYNIRETIFEAFVSHCCGIFERVND